MPHLKEQLEEAIIAATKHAEQIITCGAAIAQLIRLRLPSCCPGFEYQAHHICLL